MLGLSMIFQQAADLFYFFCQLGLSSCPTD